MTLKIRLPRSLAIAGVAIFMVGCVSTVLLFGYFWLTAGMWLVQVMGGAA